MPAVAKHRQPIIDASITLFRRQGFPGTGLNEIVEASGAPKGSLYYYFPEGKASIAVAAIEEASERVGKTLEELSQTSETTGDLLVGHARLLSKWMRASGFKDGCPVTTILLEMAPGHRQVTEAGRRAYVLRLSILTEKLVADGFNHQQAERLASLCTSAIQGALVEARVARTGRPLEIAAEELRRMLEADKPG